MNSIIMAKSRLPMDFLDEIEEEFSIKNVTKILNGMCEDRYTTFRVNQIKSNADEIKRELEKKDIDYELVSINSKNYITDAFIVKNKAKNELEDLEIYKNGKIYFQSISSMIPPIILNPSQGDCVLDLAAAPGSKTTQIAAMMRNRGRIIANEIDKIRIERLKYNIKKQGVSIAEVINTDGAEIGELYKEQFDKVLLDAPCSGEGRFLINKKDTYSKWSEKMKIELANTQKKLLESATKACKKEGRIVYSTCTLNKEEDEKIVEYGIKELGLEVKNINDIFNNFDIAQKYNVFINGNSKGLEKNVSNSVKILPCKQLEGFFIASFIKK